MLKIAVSGLKHGHVRSAIAVADADPGVEIVAIAESEDVYREDFEQATGVSVAYRTHAELLDSEQFDVLVVCEEFANRGPTAIAGLEAGKHVFADKPLCTRESDLRRIAALSREKSLEVGIDFSMRWSWGPYAESLRAGAIGELASCSIAGPHGLAYGSRPEWYFRNGLHGGVINDLLGHGVDYLRWITGEEFVRVLSAIAVNKGLPQHPDFEMSGTVHYEMSGGASVLGSVDYFVPQGHAGPWKCWLVGTEGDAIIGEVPGMRLRRSGEDEVIVECNLDRPEYKHPFARYVDFLRDGAEPLRTTEDGFKSQMATLVAQSAANSGETNVPIPEV